MDEELELVRTLLNASFAQLGYYTEIDADELAYQVDGLGYLIDERIALYLFKDGRPVAFILCIPDISEFVRRTGGNLNLPNQLRLLATRGRYRSEAIAVIKGTLPEEQGKGYMSLLCRELLRNLRAGGYETLRGTFIETRTRPRRRRRTTWAARRCTRSRSTSATGVTDLRELRRLEPVFSRAPSAHNTQPWMLEYAADRIELHVDPARRLPAGDPTGRDLELGLGAFVEAVLTAAASEGIGLAFDGGAFVPGDVYETRFQAEDIVRRQTSRLPYDGPLTELQLAAAAPSCAARSGSTRCRRRSCSSCSSSRTGTLRVAARRGRAAALAASQPSRSGVRPRRADVRVARPLVAGGPDARLRSPPRAAARGACAAAPSRVASSSASVLRAGTVLVLDSPGDVRDAGRTLLRIWLALAAIGCYTHPLSQVIDFEPTERELARRLAVEPPRRLLSVFRAGRSAPPPWSARLRATPERRRRAPRRGRRAGRSGRASAAGASSSSWRPVSTTRPRSSTTIWSASRTVESRCAIAIVVRPSDSRSSASCTSRSVSVSSELVASSSTRIGGLRRIVRAIAIRCFSPPEKR